MKTANGKTGTSDFRGGCRKWGADGEEYSELSILCCPF